VDVRQTVPRVVLGSSFHCRNASVHAGGRIDLKSLDSGRGFLQRIGDWSDTKWISGSRDRLDDCRTIPVEGATGAGGTRSRTARPILPGTGPRTEAPAEANQHSYQAAVAVRLHPGASGDAGGSQLSTKHPMECRKGREIAIAGVLSSLAMGARLLLLATGARCRNILK
jgi:hypothetical protein